MKTAVEQVAIAFRQWQKDWENYDGKKAPKPLPFDEFIKPFLELEKQQMESCAIFFTNYAIDKIENKTNLKGEEQFEQYYNETFNK